MAMVTGSVSVGYSITADNLLHFYTSRQQLQQFVCRVCLFRVKKLTVRR